MKTTPPDDLLALAAQLTNRALGWEGSPDPADELAPSTGLAATPPADTPEAPGPRPQPPEQAPGRRVSEIAEEPPIVAVKVFSPLLGEAVWVVADDVPVEQRPTDAPVYTQAEVKLLTQVGPDTLQWVHATKTMFGATVVDGKRRLTPNPASPGDAPEQE